MLILGLFLFNGALLVGSQPEVGTGSPENVTVQLIDSKTVEVFWSTNWKNVERYDITYNPTENRVVSQAAGNSHSIILRELKPNTQYQVTVTAVVGGKNFRSRRLVFRTGIGPNDTLDLEEIQPAPTKPTKLRKSYPIAPEVINPDPTAIGSKYTPPTSTTVRGVEIGLVLLALVVWIIAIALFFHRWGKIRMLLPYQPDYKTQQSLKVPGTGTTIVSGCTGSSTTQGQQDGPGCVQHLRWSSRYFDEPSTAKKSSPSKWAFRPRVSSAIFPASPSFMYSRTPAEYDSLRVIRHAHSHGEFSTEVIPLCQVTQPRSESPENIISINVPVITSSVNEKTQAKRFGEGGKKSEPWSASDGDKITKFENSDLCRKDNQVESINVDENDGLDVYCSLSYHKKEWQNGRGEKCPESEPLFFVESTDLHVREVTEPEKPRRYNRSSLKKQKFRLYDDRDLETIKNVPILEFVESNQKAYENPEKTRKTAEMKRKAFLRKVSLQDTYVNYNQDYWLDYKKSGKFHKSIDLGCFGNEDNAGGKIETNKRATDNEERNSIWREQINRSNQTEPLAITKQSKLPSTPGVAKYLKKCGSDSVIFRGGKSCRNCGWVAWEGDKNDSSELLTEVIAKCKRKGGREKKSGWFLLPSNENIPLFSERNGLIETDFDLLGDEGCPLVEKLVQDVDSTKHQVFYNGGTEATGNNFAISSDFSNFYEIQLTTESEAESVKSPNLFNFEGGSAFFGNTLTSMSGDSDVFYETEPVSISEDGKKEFLYYVRSSSSPPKSNPD